MQRKRKKREHVDYESGRLKIQYLHSKAGRLSWMGRGIREGRGGLETSVVIALEISRGEAKRCKAPVGAALKEFKIY